MVQAGPSAGEASSPIASGIAGDRNGSGAPAVKRPRLAENAALASSIGSSGEWVEVISALQPAIVALKVTCVRSYEEDPASTSVGTGFVVDRHRGIILTNRHITGVGPVRATAIFDRHEELEVEVLYRDPVHDFGFFQYDPAKLRLTQQAEIPLDPEGLKVGAEILVVGNDAGEKLQILSGTIARVDRNVPEFNSAYNDENTFYAGAGAGTSGGSSGSPVLSKRGRAIALNAAGQEGTASAYFVPLDRVVYSLERLKAKLPVHRGTCLAALIFKPFDELIRVGLQRKHEEEVLAVFPAATGMLIVETVVREQELLRPGDILLRIEGEVCIGFVQFEAVLDARVGSSVKLQICRAGEVMDVEVPVRDLHALIPRRFVEMGLDLLHEVGYHVAKRVHLPLDSGLYLARSGLVFDSLDCCGRASLITAVNSRPVPTLEAFAEAIRGIADRQYFPVSWYDLPEFRRDRTIKMGFAKMSWSWPRLRLWSREGAHGEPEHWQPTDLDFVPSQASPQPSLAVVGPTSFMGGDPLVRRLQGSLVKVGFRTDRRFISEGSMTGSSDGVGLIIDAEQGLVLTDRHSAPQALGDVEVKLAGSMTVDAEVFFIHPLHNLAVVRYDAAPLKKAKLPLRAASMAKGPKTRLRAGEAVYFVGFDGQNNLFSAEVRVAASYLPSGRDEFPMWDVPRFHECNLEIVVLADSPEDARGGVLCDASGSIRALYAAFDWQDPNHHAGQTTEAFGIACSVFAPLVEALRQAPAAAPVVPSLDIEVTAVDLSTLARGTAGGKLPPGWLQAVGHSCSSQGRVPRVLKVGKVLPLGASAGVLKHGDVLLSIAGCTVVGCDDLEEALRGAVSELGRPIGAKGRRRSVAPRKRPAAASEGSGGTDEKESEGCHIVVKVFREGAEVDLKVAPSKLGSEDVDFMIIWAGIVLRRTPRCALERCGDAIARASGAVYAQAILGGSPADGRDFMTHWFLLDIDGHPIKALEDVLKVLDNLRKDKEAPADKQRPWVRVRLLDLDGREHLKAVQGDPLFWPTMELRRGNNGRWECKQH